MTLFGQVPFQFCQASLQSRELFTYGRVFSLKLDNLFFSCYMPILVASQPLPEQLL